jgi:asparagine synthase (glutamine-hydrolysing)
MFGRADGEVVEAMLSALVHRGPDDGHHVTGRGFALGARRLSIVDLAAGRQPMANETGTIWAAQNGELYNFPELRPDLIKRGHHLHTHCDTEMLPHLYEDYGHDLPRHIDGMFAVAIWDETTQTGLLSRDRMGKKPLYYFQRGDVLYFASEIKSLLRIPGFERRLNLQAIHHYLSYKHVPHPFTCFEGIWQLPPAHRLTFQPGREPRLERYWHLPVDVDPELANLPEAELVDHLLALLRRGVERRLMADVPIGFFLSGGLDSSLSTALAAEICPERIKTFTLTYGDDSTTPGKEEDRRWARWVAEKYQTDHLEETVAFGDFADNFRRALTAFDEPFGGVISTYFLAKLISKHVKVALAGDGADELFGSYLSHRLAFPLGNWTRFQMTGDAALIRPFEDKQDFLKRFVGQPDWVWRSQLFVFDDAAKMALYAPDVAEALRGCRTRDHLRQAFARLEKNDPLNRILKAEFCGIFPDQVLAFVDRLSMAHSLEVRSAFLDTEFVSFVARLPGHMKIRKGETKYLLKRAAERYFPRAMVYRPKEGFVMPINGWLVQKLEGYVRETLSATQLRRHGLFDASSVQAMVQEFYAGKSEHANRLLNLLAFQEWYDLYKPTVGSLGLARAA